MLFRSGKDKTTSLTTFRDYAHSFAQSHPGPIVMFNLLSFLPNQLPQYLKYVSGFLSDMSPRYGPDPLVHGMGTVTDWSSQAEETNQKGMWEGVGIIWYPSLLHFAKMLDDDEYAELDRAYKFGVLKDNALMCCTSIILNE